MARYIDADALQAQLERKKAGVANQRYTEGWNDCMMRVKSMVSTAPTADVAMIAKYIDKDDYTTDVYWQHPTHCEFKCLKCGAWVGVVEGGTFDGGKFDFCPHCGRRIIKEDNK